MATSSATNTIRQNVINMITQSKAKENTVVRQIKTLPTAQRYSRLITAAASLHRAQNDPTYKLSEERQKDCAAAAMILAEKRGIKPEDNGKYKPEQIKEFLDPKKMLTDLTTLYINDAKADNKTEADTRQAIEKDIETAYDNDKDAAQPAVAIAKSAPSKLPDEIILSMGDDEFNQYVLTQDSSEQERLNNARNEKTGKEPNKDEIGRFKGLRDDPDWGHKKDDDDFKIEQGDIIEYLMKDVILASTAWAGNRVAGFAGNISYELLSCGTKEILPLGRTLKNKIGNVYTKIFGDKGKESSDDDTPPPNPEEQTREQVFSQMTGAYEQNVTGYNDAIEKQQENLKGGPAVEKWQLLERQIAKHYAVLGDDGITFDDGTTKPYADYCDPGVDPKNLKENLKEFQKTIDNQNIEFMIKDLGFENNPEKQKEVKDWYKQYTQNQESSTKNKRDVVEVPAPREFMANYQKAIKEKEIQMTMYPHTRTLEAQIKLFAEHYSRHKYLEEYRKNPNNEIFADTQKSAQFIAKQQQEAKLIILMAEKARREGKKELNGHPILSREGMIDEAKKLADASKKALEQNKNDPIQDTKLKPLTEQTPVDDKTEKSLYEAAVNGTAPSQYASHMHNLDMAEQEQNLNKESVDSRRKNLQEWRKKIIEKTKGPDGKGGVDISKQYTQQGGRN